MEVVRLIYELGGRERKNGIERNKPNRNKVKK